MEQSKYLGTDRTNLIGNDTESESPIALAEPVKQEALGRRVARRVRIVCISNTHNANPQNLPSGDILIHAGDLTNQGSYPELMKVATWLRNLGKGYQYKVVIPGNHDLCLDREWLQNWGETLKKNATMGVDREGDEDLGKDGWKERLWRKCVELFDGTEAKTNRVVYLGPKPERDGVLDGEVSEIGVLAEGKSRESNERISGQFVDLKEERKELTTITSHSGSSPRGAITTLTLSTGDSVTIYASPYIPRLAWITSSSSSSSPSISGAADTSSRPNEWAFGYIQSQHLSTASSLETSIWSHLSTRDGRHTCCQVQFSLV